jgi:hypothetical protein
MLRMCTVSSDIISPVYADIVHSILTGRPQGMVIPLLVAGWVTVLYWGWRNL